MRRWEVVATLRLPLPSFSSWRREARCQGCSLLGSRMTSSLGTQACTPSDGSQCLSKPASTLPVAAAWGAMRRPDRRPAAGCIL